MYHSKIVSQPTVKFIYENEEVKVHPLTSGARQGCSLSPV